MGAEHANPLKHHRVADHRAASGVTAVAPVVAGKLVVDRDHRRPYWGHVVDIAAHQPPARETADPQETRADGEGSQAKDQEKAWGNKTTCNAGGGGTGSAEGLGYLYKTVKSEIFIWKKMKRSERN